MAHLISAAALEAAGNLRKRFDLTVKSQDELSSGRVPSIQNDERCLAIVIDYATNVFEVAKLRPELRYWQERLHAGTATAPKIAGYLQRMIEAFDKIPQFAPQEGRVTTTLMSPAEFKARPEICELTKASLEAARFVFHYYHVRAKNGATDEELNRVRVAKLVETSMGLSRAMRAYGLAQRAKEKLALGRSTLDDVKAQFRELGVILEYLPNYENREEECKLLM